MRCRGRLSMWGELAHLMVFATQKFHTDVRVFCDQIGNLHAFEMTVVVTNETAKLSFELRRFASGASFEGCLMAAIRTTQWHHRLRGQALHRLHKMESLRGRSCRCVVESV